MEKALYRKKIVSSGNHRLFVLIIAALKFECQEEKEEQRVKKKA